MRSTIAIGVFDGLHVGHVSIVERALARARDSSDRCAVVSFDPHPDLVLSPSFQPMPPLTPIAERRRRLEAMGVDELVVLAFTRELAGLAPEEFVDRHLAPLAPRLLVVGEDFALGRGRAGNVPRLRELGAVRGFGIEAVPLVHLGGTPVTSTRIRALLANGRVAETADLLGRRYDLTGRVVSGEAIGRELGFPTANLRLEDDKLVPADGIYAAWVRMPNEGRVRPGAVSIGLRPTFGGQTRAIEVHVLDFAGDLYGRTLTLEFAEWLRPEERFESREQLVVAIDRDVAEVRRRLGPIASGSPG